MIASVVMKREAVTHEDQTGLWKLPVSGVDGKELAKEGGKKGTKKPVSMAVNKKELSR